MRSTSIHRLNADRGLSRHRRALYLVLNWLNNQFPYTGVSRDVAVRDFCLESLDSYWPRLSRTSSPSRKLSDLFWMSLPWERIERELGEIVIVDNGCGKGSYGPKLSEWSGRRIRRYVGLDACAHENWLNVTADRPECTFCQSDAADFLQHVPSGANLFITQSAVEHFEEDVTFIERIRDYVIGSGRSVLQIHLMPSSACLELYGPHGVRQYTPRTISKFVRLFERSSYSVLFGLGGTSCNRVHRDYITVPEASGVGDMRGLRTDEYDAKSRRAIEDDMQRPQLSPAFYALVIHSHCSTRLFENWNALTV